jgi:nucleoside phosphorylase
VKFNEILNSVTSAQRTNKFKVIAALYCLGALENPVTAKQVEDLLKQHLRSKTPPNVHAILLKNSALVEVIKGKPLKWGLLSKGLIYLHKLVPALPVEKVEKSISSFDFDIGIICALELPEFSAVMRATGGESKWTELSDARYPHVYRQTELTTSKGQKLKIIGVTSTSMGLTAAAIATTQLAMLFRPRIIAMIGIAAGTNDGKKSFGDILIADPSIDYASGKISNSKGKREFKPDPYPLGLNARLRSLLQRYRGNSEFLAEIKKKWTGKTPPQKIQLHIGPVGAADQVIDDPSRIAEIQLNWRKLIGIEMETYGVYRAAHEAPEPKARYVSFKSVCDFAELKDDSWQEYAAYTAAEFALRFFEKEWHNLWPKDGGTSE